MAQIDLVNIYKRYRKSERSSLRILGYHKRIETTDTNYSFFSIENLNLHIEDSETIVILGPSGCGKTTILKIIAGLLPIDSGTITFDGVDVKQVPPRDRKIGMVFQDYALYPHFTARVNILSYFFFKKKTAELYEMAKEKFDRTSELMGVDIEYLLDRKADKLSGGEKQRVAIGRCITRDPRVFLLDEPFANLDKMSKEKYHPRLKQLLGQFNVTTVYVTHDQQEALLYADKIAIMSNGKIEQVGTCDDIYNNPENLFVAEFLNPDVHVTAINAIKGEIISREFDNAIIGVRPDHIQISSEMKPDFTEATVTEINPIPLQKARIINAQVKETPLQIKTTEFHGISPGEKIWVKFERFHTFHEDTGKKIKSYYPAE